MAYISRPGRSGLYEPSFEHESCGVGFVARLSGEGSHEIVEFGNRILTSMSHRGAVGSEPDTGDGAGILTAIPHAFLVEAARRDAGIVLPEPGSYAVGMVFFPQEREARERCRQTFVSLAVELGLPVLGWRQVPRDNSGIGPTAKTSEPTIEQVFVMPDRGISGNGRSNTDGVTDRDRFERQLFLLRKRATHLIRGNEAGYGSMFHVASLSSRTIVYKGMLTPGQLFGYYPDLSDSAYVSRFAMVHSRFSTNTFPSWDRAQPLRYMSHNGEINTLRGNINKMRSREGTLRSELFGDALRTAFPVIEPDLSDSGTFDNVLELLLRAGRSLPEAIMMMIPEAWENHTLMSAGKRAFYEYSSCTMEPWDGPASIAFTDGTCIGAVLDRNGLRPSRYYLTEDGLVVMASEVGVLEIPAERVKLKGRLEPGKMFLVDFELGRIVDDAEIKERIAGLRPYREWLESGKVTLEDLVRRTGAAHAEGYAGSNGTEPVPEPHLKNEPDSGLPSDRRRLQRGGVNEHDTDPSADDSRLPALFGYTAEHLETIIAPMAAEGSEPLGSMGNDTPLAALSSRPRLLYEYFKQLFAQVTNPPIDSTRESLVMSLGSYIGPERNLLEPGPDHARRLFLPRPLLTDSELQAVLKSDLPGLSAVAVRITYPAGSGEAGLRACLDRICAECERAIEDGYGFAVLTDRTADKDSVPVPALMAVGAVHHHLVRRSMRTRIGLILESGEPREVHHFCMLAGYGADAVNPYLALRSLRRPRAAESAGYDTLVENYFHAVEKGMRKVFAKMGISTLESYKGAQIFEAVGLDREVVERCFAGTASRIEGTGFAVLASEAEARHAAAFGKRAGTVWNPLAGLGEYGYRFGGETHMWDPESIAELRNAVRTGDRGSFKRFTGRQDSLPGDRATIRGLLRFRAGHEPVPIEEVEPAHEIVKRFVTGAMSYGSISKEAHETLAVAMNRLGGKSNTGEGGEDADRYRPLPDGDSKRSAIKQIASGRFGVTIEYLANADEFQIKMAQGAKPGEGGELPGRKVYEWIAKTRHSTPGVGLISPPPHHDIYSIEDLAQLIFDLKNANPSARVSVKLVSEVGVGTVAAGVAKTKADHILISGHDGGTGASPLTGIRHAGLPWELGLAETHQTLVLNDLRSRVVLQTDGQLKTGRDVVIAAMLGAEEFGFATAALVSLGCVMMRKCQNDTCPVGIATQDPELRKRFDGKPEYVTNFFMLLAEEIREHMAALGFRRFLDLVGRSDLLELDPAALTDKTARLDLTAVLTPAWKLRPGVGVYRTKPQNHEIEELLDRRLIEESRAALETGRQVSLLLPIRNTDRAVGTMLSHEIAKRYPDEGLPPGTIHVKFRGSAGQSFGAWLARGVTLELEGDANDYFGKGLSGGRLVVYPPRVSRFDSSENIIVGNVSFYGATAGDAFVRGRAAERFCVRNSGARVVVEGAGDHGCEYMTGGTAVILGPVGRNFAAGMSGGTAYVYDPERRLGAYLNREITFLEEPDPVSDETDELFELIRLHRELTGSPLAAEILERWNERLKLFVKIVPPEYRLAMERQEERRRAEAYKEAVNG